MGTYSLDFGVSSFGRIEISEPPKSDAFAFKLKQDTNRHGRDKTIGGDDVPLLFWQSTNEPTNKLRMSTQGVVLHHLTLGFDELIATRNNVNKGFESQVRFIYSEGGVDFVNGLIDFAESKTDEFSYFECNIVQETKRAIIERRADTVINVFDTVDANGNAITPCVKTKFLMKALPEDKISEWTQIGHKIHDALEANSNFAANLTSYGVEDSFVFFDNYPNTNGYENSVNNYKMARFRDAQTNAQITFDVDGDFVYKTRNLDTDDSCHATLEWGVYNEPYTLGDAFVHHGVLYSHIFSGDVDDIIALPTQITTPVFDAAIGQCVYAFWNVFFVRSVTGDSNHRPFLDFRASKTTMTSTATAIDSVNDAVLYPDFLEKGIESIGNLPTIQERIRNGWFKDQFVFNGNMQRQDSTKLNFVFKDEMNNLREGNLDYQINETAVIIAHESDFYPNNDLGFFDAHPDQNIEKIFNDKHKIINVDVKYKTYEKSETATGTIDSFHTEDQLLIPNTEVEKKLNIDIDYVRDPFAIEKSRLASLKTTTAADSDNKIFIVDAVLIPAGTYGGFKCNLMYGSTGIAGQVTLSNSTNDDTRVNFDWNFLGFDIGDTFSFEDITSLPGTIFNCTVVSITRSVITLMQIGTTNVFSGIAFTSVSYLYTTVLWTNRTTEDFNLISNLNAKDRCSNLKYTIGRNREQFGSLLNTICIGHPTGTIQNKGFINNGDLTTQFLGGAVIVEKANVSVAGLPDKLITNNVYKSKFSVGFAQGKQYIEDSVRLNANFTVGGFFRFYNGLGRICKGYSKELAMSWRMEFMETTTEEKWESDTLTINTGTAPYVIVIAETGYISAQLLAGQYYDISGDYLQIFDKDNKGIINSTDYHNVSINGVQYTDLVSFTNALINI